MRDWTRLKQRLSDLELRGVQTQIARHLIAGRTTREIADLMFLPEQQAKLHVIGILYLLGRLPPDDPATVTVPIPRRPPSLAPAYALKLPLPDSATRP